MINVISIEENKLPPSNLPIDIVIKKEAGNVPTQGVEEQKVRSKAKTKNEKIAKPAKEKRLAFTKKAVKKTLDANDFESVADGGATEILSDVYIEGLYLECITPTGPRKIDIAAEEFIIGSSSEADATIDFNPGISRKHCKITYSNEAYYVEDMGSANGTYLNKIKMEDEICRLKDGDKLQLANTLFTVRER